MLPESTAQNWPSSLDAKVAKEWVTELIVGAKSASPTAVQPLLILLKVVREHIFEMAPELVAECKEALLSFDYSRTAEKDVEKGAWCEANQICFAVAEYLAGSFLPNDHFFLDQATGKAKFEAAKIRIEGWLTKRFRYGQSDWLDPVAIQLETGALSLLFDFAPDLELRDRVEIMISTLLIDATLHQFRGNLIASAGRIPGSLVRDPANSGFNHWWSKGVLGEQSSKCSRNKVCCLFCNRVKYQVPQPILDLARTEPYRSVKTSQGISLEEVAKLFTRFGEDNPADIDDYLLGMDAIPVVHRPKNLTGKKTPLPPKQFLAQLSESFSNPLKSLRNRRDDSQLLQRANVQSFVTKCYSLSSVQRYFPGSFGGQQLIWQAQLQGGIVVFGNHPGDNLRDSSSLSPLDRWALHGILPDVAQLDNVLLAIADLRGRKGYQEGKRAEYVQFYFPSVKFDETRIGPRWIAGRSGNAYLAIIGTHALELISESEVIQRGKVTGYAIVMADEEEVTSMGAFVRLIKSYSLNLRGDRLEMTSPFGQYNLTWQKDFVVGGQKIPTEYPRYDSHWIQAPRNPSKLEIHGEKTALVLDWTNHVSKTRKLK